MSSIPTRMESAFGPAERRAHPRRRLEQLAYVGFGPDCGGVLLDISEGGLNCQIVGAFVEGDLCRLRFALPGLPSVIQADGQVVWSNHSRRGGGLRLLDLGEETRQQLQQWICGAIPAPNGSKPIPVPIHAKTPAPAYALPEPGDSQPVPTAVVVQNEPPPWPSSGLSGPATVPRPKVAPAGPRASGKKLLDSTAGPPHLLTPSRIRPEALSVAASPQRRLRVLGIVAVALCFILAAVLTFVRTDFASVAASFKAQAPADASIARPAVRTPWPPPRQPSGNASHAAPLAVQPDLPESRVVKPAPATPSRPVQRPAAPVTNSRRPLSMTLPRPRRTTLAPPAVVRPAPPAQAAMAPPIALVDPQVIARNLPELPEPPRPQATTYQPPELIARVEPVYSRFARDARLQGTVRVRTMIGKDGVPRSLSAVSGNARLTQMAFEAIRRWRYKPAMLNGQPIEAPTIIAITFQLQ